MGEIASFDQFHREKVLPFLLTYFVYLDDIRMMQPRRGFGLALKAADELRAGEFTGQQHLEGDKAVQTFLPGAIYHPHSPPGDFIQQFIIAKRAENLRRTEIIEG